MEKFVRRGMPRAICTTHIVETGGSAAGERVVPSGFVHSGAQGPVLEHLFLSGLGDAFINGRLADALTLDAPYSSARGRGRIPFPIGFASGLPH